MGELWTNGIKTWKKTIQGFSSCDVRKQRTKTEANKTNQSRPLYCRLLNWLLMWLTANSKVRQPAGMDNQVKVMGCGSGISCLKFLNCQKGYCFTGLSLKIIVGVRLVARLTASQACDGVRSLNKHLVYEQNWSNAFTYVLYLLCPRTS